MTTILVTGFGPFPGAPFNPTVPLVAQLARRRRPALAGLTIVPHIFPTSYAAVARELPALIARHRPDALLMFGLAGRTAHLRLESRARNTVTLGPDAEAGALARRAIAAGAASAKALPAPLSRLLGALRAADVPARLSHDAGGYLCNYLCWQAAGTKDLRLAAFIHVPLVRRGPRRRGARRRLTPADLARAGERALVAMAAAARARGR